MNTKNKILAGLFSMAALFSSCNDFQEINEDPNQVDESKVKPDSTISRRSRCSGSA